MEIQEIIFLIKFYEEKLSLHTGGCMNEELSYANNIVPKLNKKLTEMTDNLIKPSKQ